MARKEREVVAAFQAAKATSATTGRTLGELGIDARVAVDRLQRQAILREATNGGFYLDEPRWQALRVERRRPAFILMIVALAVLLVALVLSRRPGS